MIELHLPVEDGKLPDGAANVQGSCCRDIDPIAVQMILVFEEFGNLMVVQKEVLV